MNTLAGMTGALIAPHFHPLTTGLAGLPNRFTDSESCQRIAYSTGGLCPCSDAMGKLTEFRHVPTQIELLVLPIRN